VQTETKADADAPLEKVNAVRSMARFETSAHHPGTVNECDLDERLPQEP